MSTDLLARCIDACEECAQACTSCADACLGESDVRDLTRCIRLCLDCADVCGATARVLARQQDPDQRLVMRLVHLAALTARACAEECAKHAGMKHCDTCAQVCRRCEDACCAVTTC
jgi:hypothetical protein